MAAEESKDTHVVVEIPLADAAGEQQEQQQQQQTTFSCFSGSADDSAALHHPLTQISQSPGHLLLLRLWQREEDLHGQRAGALESRMDFIKRDAFHLCCLFFAFHALFLTLLFTSSIAGDRAGTTSSCRNWLVPSCLSLITSLVLVCAVQTKLCAYWKVSRGLQREREDGRALGRCMQELRMKGASFDLSKEPQIAKRLKSSSVEVKWRRPLRWCSRNLVTVCLLCFTGMVFPSCKFILCG